MQVVSELGEPFAPLPDDLLVNLRESRAVIDTLLNSLPSAFASTGIVSHTHHAHNLQTCTRLSGKAWFVSASNWLPTVMACGSSLQSVGDTLHARVTE